MDSSPSWVQGVRAKESEHAEGGGCRILGTSENEGRRGSREGRKYGRLREKATQEVWPLRRPEPQEQSQPLKDRSVSEGGDRKGVAH